MAENSENWRQFQGTELGNLMSSLYGGEKPKIQYPKPKLRKNPSDSVPEKFIPAGARSTATDPRMSTRRSVNIAVPKPASQKSSAPKIAPIDYIPKRKPEIAIKRELDDMKMRDMHYRPAHTKAVSTEYEKDRFSQVCEYKGGKALPQELIAPARDTPFELLEKKKESDRIAKVRMKRAGISEESLKHRESPALSYKEQLAQQIASEIDDRRQHLTDMLKIGLSAAEEARMTAEIRRRITELSALDA